MIVEVLVTRLYMIEITPQERAGELTTDEIRDLLCATDRVRLSAGQDYQELVYSNRRYMIDVNECDEERKLIEQSE